MTETDPESEAPHYEMLVRQDGLLEIRNRDAADCWIATDSPAELER